MFRLTQTPVISEGDVVVHVHFSAHLVSIPSQPHSNRGLSKIFLLR